MATLSTFNDGGFSKKIFSLTTYDVSLISSVHSGKNKQMIELGAAKLVVKYFEHMVDAKARANPSSLHHVYEFDRTGDKNARLFKNKITQSPVGAVISFSFIDTKQPNRNGYMFYKKAEVMESGKTVTVRPKSSKFLSYMLEDGRFIRTENPSVIKNPGGAVAGNFESEFNDFKTYQASKVLKEFRFFERVNDNIKMKRMQITPRISNLSISNYAAQAKMDATKIAMEAYRDSG